MSKNILVVYGSPRPKGNSTMLADAFVEGAEAAGHKVTKLSLTKSNIAPCRACYACTSGKIYCAQKDDMLEMYPIIEKCDVIVLASPVYYFGFSAQMKAFVDRLFSLNASGRIHSVYNKELPPKESVLLMTAGDDNQSIFDLSLSSYKQIFEKWFEFQTKGIILVDSVDDAGAISENPKLEEAKKLGASI